MTDWSHIQYRGFHDVPRVIIALRGKDMYLFDSRFDDDTDEYLDHYEVWRLPVLSPEQLAGSWVGIERHAVERLSDVGLNDLPFHVPRAGEPGHIRSGEV